MQNVFVRHLYSNLHPQKDYMLKYTYFLTLFFIATSAQAFSNNNSSKINMDAKKTYQQRASQIETLLQRAKIQPALQDPILLLSLTHRKVILLLASAQQVLLKHSTLDASIAKQMLILEELCAKLGEQHIYLSSKTRNFPLQKIEEDLFEKSITVATKIQSLQPYFIPKRGC